MRCLGCFVERAVLGRLLRTSTFVLMSLLLSTAPSQAGVPIPCTGESLVKVLDIPALAHVEVDASAARACAQKRVRGEDRDIWCAQYRRTLEGAD